MLALTLKTPPFFGLYISTLTTHITQTVSSVSRTLSANIRAVYPKMKWFVGVLFLVVAAVGDKHCGEVSWNVFFLCSFNNLKVFYY